MKTTRCIELWFLGTVTAYTAIIVWLVAGLLT